MCHPTVVSLPRPTVTLAVVVLLGLPLVLAPFAVPAPDLDRTYESVAVEPEADATVVAHRVDEVVNLTADADTPADRDVLDRAADGAAMTVPDRESPLATLSDHEYAVYDGRYYRVVTRPGENASVPTITPTTDTETEAEAKTEAEAEAEAEAETETEAGAETTQSATPSIQEAPGFEPFTLRLRPVAGETVVSSLAEPYGEVRPAVQRIVDEGEATISPPDGDGLGRLLVPPEVPSVVVRDGTYYAVSEVNPLATVGSFAEFYLRAAFLPGLQRLGVTYVGFAVGTYALAAVRGRRDPLTERRGLGLLGGVFALQVATAALQSPVTSAGAPFDALPAGVGATVVTVLIGGLAAVSTLPVAAMLLVGVAWHRHGLGRRVSLAVGGVAVALLGHAALSAVFSGSVGPAVFAVLIGGIGLLTAVPVVGLGYVHAGDAETAPESDDDG